MAQLTLPLILILGVASSQAFPEDVKRIVGGSDAKPGQYPYQVSLRIRGSHFCGGTLVSRRHVVTAAHCIDGTVLAPYSNITVMTGSISLKNGGQVHRISNAVIHPDYIFSDSKAYPNDIGVITLAEPIVENDNQKIIPLATENPPVGAELRLTGWGVTAPAGLELPDTLQTTTTRLLSNEECQEKLRMYPIRKGHLCAFRQKGIGACYGDSGSSLVYDGLLVGVPSWVYPTCAQGNPDVFTRVSQYTDFVNKIIARS